MFVEQQLPDDIRNDLIRLMHELGYKVDKMGLCAGIIQMWVQAVLCDEEEKFHQRLEWIRKFFKEKREINKNPAKEIIQAIDAVKVKLKADEHNAPKASDRVAALKDEERNLLEITAFLEGVAAYLNPEDYAEVFGRPLSQTHVEAISYFTKPLKLEGKDIQEVYSYPAIGYAKDVNKYFSDLANEFKNEKRTPICLSCDDHIIGLKYIDNPNDPENAYWEVFDINKQETKRVSPKDLPQVITQAFFNNDYYAKLKSTMPTEDEFKAFQPNGYFLVNDKGEWKLIFLDDRKKKVQLNIDDIAELRDVLNQLPQEIPKGLVGIDESIITKILTIMNSYHISNPLNKDIVGFNMNVYATKDRAMEIKKKCDTFKKRHEITYEMVKQKTNRSITLGYLAAQWGDVDLICRLHELGDDLNKPSKDGKTPAMVAAYEGHENAIKALAKLGVDLNISTKDGESISVIAARNGHANVLDVLEQNNITIYDKTKIDTTIKLAIDGNHWSAVARVLISPKLMMDDLNRWDQKRIFTDSENVVRGLIQLLDAMPEKRRDSFFKAIHKRKNILGEMLGQPIHKQPWWKFSFSKKDHQVEKLSPSWKMLLDYQQSLKEKGKKMRSKSL